MKITENSIIPIYQDRAADGEFAHEQYVNARDLHEALKVGRDYSTWFKERIEKYGFMEGQDFSPVLGKSTGGRPGTEYLLTIDCAKEIAMVENNETGRQLRRYFIEAEKRYRNYEKLRLKSKTERRVLTDIIKELVPESPGKVWVYKHYTDLVYKLVTGYTAKEIREMKGLDEKANIRPHLSEDELGKIVKYERIIQSCLSVGMDYEDIKTSLTNLSVGRPAVLKGAI